MTQLIVAREAESDRDAILNYLEQEAGSRTAAAYAERFAASLLRLRDFPALGTPRPSLGPDARVTIVYPYILIYDYSVSSDTITLLRILHGRRNITARLIPR